MKKLLFCVACLGALPAFANEPEVLGTFDKWNAFAVGEGTEKVCYMATEPKKSTGKYSKRDDVFLLVTHRPSANSYDVVSIETGFTYQAGSKPSFRIDNQKAINMAVDNDRAWFPDNATDTKVIPELIKGSNVIVKAKSKRGTAITDTYSLKGFSKAYSAIQKACGRE